MFNVGPAEIAVVFGVALLIFGPKKLPELGRSLGQGIGNFKKSLTDAQSEMKAALKDAEVDTNASAASPEEKTANKS
ncbi:MAG: twin-arginine translocase TatA/TatE family subunit [Candidatus Obscuribacterales bacterium]|jgi:sec-independent protein translocase protein TatA|nr:twin-arginine translocase TatA/TatE family subunit [Candidatus Obscuribacterales bacterium]